jgi:hypothetical protein
VAALNGMQQKVVLIAGGDGKGQDFSPLNAAVAARARAVVLIGRDRDKIAQALEGSGVPLQRARDMDEAVQQAFARLAGRCGDAVARVRELRHVPQLRASRAGVRAAVQHLGSAMNLTLSLRQVGLARIRRSAAVGRDRLLASAGDGVLRRRSRSPRRPYGVSQPPISGAPACVRRASALAGIVAFQVPMRLWQQAAPYLFLFGAVLLVLVLIPGIGREVNGSRRWLPLIVVNLQPSELTKLFVVLYAADYTVRKAAWMHSFKRGFLPMFAVMLCAGALLLLEPDFGAFAVIAAIAMGVLFLGGMNWRLFAGLAVLLVIGFVVIIVTSPYRMQRILGFLDPWADPYGKGYQLSHALIAFGAANGSAWDSGASVEKLFYLPEAHTDFCWPWWEKSWVRPALPRSSHCSPGSRCARSRSARRRQSSSATSLRWWRRGSQSGSRCSRSSTWA